jgi:hypothetical protein
MFVQCAYQGFDMLMDAERFRACAYCVGLGTLTTRTTSKQKTKKHCRIVAARIYATAGGNVISTLWCPKKKNIQ